MFVKNTKEQRIRKRQREKQRDYYVMTPPKHTERNSARNTFYRKAEKNGYGYDHTESKVLFEMHEEYVNKFAQHNDKNVWMKKKGNKDKYEANLKYGKLEKNPIVGKFDKVERLLRKHLKQGAFEMIREEAF